MREAAIPLAAGVLLFLSSCDYVRLLRPSVGWGGWTKGFAPELYGAPRGNTLVVFALP